MPCYRKQAAASWLRRWLKVLDALKEGGQANANKYVNGAWGQRIEGVWMEVYINGLLSYFPTHLKNALATPLFMTYNMFTI